MDDLFAAGRQAATATSVGDRDARRALRGVPTRRIAEASAPADTRLRKVFKSRQAFKHEHDAEDGEPLVKRTKAAAPVVETPVVPAPLYRHLALTGQ